MGDRPEKGRTGTSRRQPAEERERRRREASGATEVPRTDDIDAREEEGWTQPESSAQKGVLPDEG